MQTRCPHCSTQFRITESQVNTADGYVRCGVCDEVFNAFEVANEQDQQASLLDRQVLADTDTNITSEAKGQGSDPDVITAADSTTDTADVRPAMLDDNHKHKQSGSLADSMSYNETAGNTSVSSARDDFDFFDDDMLASRKSVIPDELRDLPAAIDLSTLLWSAGTLLLIATLFLQYAWFNRHQLKQIPEMQGWIDSLCVKIDCTAITLRDPDNIELVSRNIYSHPDIENALKVEVSMKNNAEFAQPYPVMQIDFSDIRGNKVAARQFLPSEYLQIESEKLEPIQPESKLDFTMEIVDPGKQAKTYEFNFL